MTQSNSTKKSVELMKYGQFLTKKIKELPKWEEFFLDRVSTVSSYLSQIKHQKLDECLLNTLQFVSDILVYSLKLENQSTSFSFLKEQEREKFAKNDESESLLLTINAQSERIAKLNKQISEAMISSKELLYSPLAPVIRKEKRPSKSVSGEFQSKYAFSTPDIWRMKSDTIIESNVDEEASGKPLG